MQKFSNDMIAQANAMEVEGISTRRTVERLRRLFPDEDIPAHHAVHEWRRKRHESLHEELVDNELVIALMADELVVDKLKWCKDNMKTARLAELVMAAGVYRDKPMKRATLNTPNIQAQSIVINFVVQKNPDVIEGEVVE